MGRFFGGRTSNLSVYEGDQEIQVKLIKQLLIESNKRDEQAQIEAEEKEAQKAKLEVIDKEAFNPHHKKAKVTKTIDGTIIDRSANKARRVEEFDTRIYQSLIEDMEEKNKEEKAEKAMKADVDKAGITPFDIQCLGKLGPKTIEYIEEIGVTTIISMYCAIGQNFNQDRFTKEVKDALQYYDAVGRELFDALKLYNVLQTWRQTKIFAAGNEDIYRQTTGGMVNAMTTPAVSSCSSSSATDGDRLSNVTHFTPNEINMFDAINSNIDDVNVTLV